MLPFHPEKTVAISVTASAALTAIGSTDFREVIITSPAANPIIFVKFGDAGVTATATDSLPILPGTAQSLHVSEPNISTIAASGTGTLYVSTGRGI